MMWKFLVRFRYTIILPKKENLSSDFQGIVYEADSRLSLLFVSRFVMWFFLF
jgi:hypothetical protein